ncbi:hypothetical protein [Neisseria basseii]|uniref:hypothetical protein n=1 Tax=Neisseria basseii TaxID=2830650 RepID=UPI0026582C92|nr:hypothetical protein [Neisseria basseii]
MPSEIRLRFRRHLNSSAPRPFCLQARASDAGAKKSPCLAVGLCRLHRRRFGLVCAVGHLCGYALIFGSAVLPVLAGIFSSASIVNLLILPFAKSVTQWLRCPCF